MMSTPEISVVVPTYREVLNIPDLTARIEAALHGSTQSFELIIVDDDSRDGTPQAVAELGKDWVILITRTKDRGLSQSVVEGFRRARGKFLVVMDADLSHPPEQIPALVAAVASGADFALGSRCVEGGTTDAAWTLYRRVNSGIATVLALGLTRAKDPMSGFFCVTRETLDRAPWLNPIGYKIGLEVMVKCGCERVTEVPIHFSERVKGNSKLSLKEQLKYLQHLRRLYQFKYDTLYHFFEFALVGLTGVVVNLAFLTVLLQLGLDFRVALIGSIAGSMVSNFALNRRLTFSYARAADIRSQFAGFCLACTAGAIVNYLTAIGVHRYVPGMLPQLAALCGIATGTIINFGLNRFVVFKKRH